MKGKTFMLDSSQKIIEINMKVYMYLYIYISERNIINVDRFYKTAYILTRI